MPVTCNPVGLNKFVDSRNWHGSRPKCHPYLVYHLLGIISPNNPVTGIVLGQGFLVQGLVPDTETGMVSPEGLSLTSLLGVF